MDKNLETEYRKLKGLKSLRDKPYEYILARAEANLRKKSLDISKLFVDPEEASKARELLDKYLTDYSIETISDKNTLQEVIYLEVIQARLQAKMNEFYNADTKAVPTNVLEVIHKNSDAIIRLKNTLGLNRGKEKREAYDVLQHLIRRADKWRDENQGSRTLKCPKCSQFILLKIRTQAWEAQGHPFYKDTMLYNKALFEKYYGQTVVVNDKFIAEVLEVSEDFPAWVKQKSRPQEETNEQPTQPSDPIIESVTLEEVPKAWGV